MYSHVACDVMKERTLYLLKPSSLIWHLMPYLFLLGLCLMFNFMKLKLNDINLSIYAVEIVFETIFHGNGRNMTYEKEFY